jgi:hypothetical protein
MMSLAQYDIVSRARSMASCGKVGVCRACDAHWSVDFHHAPKDVRRSTTMTVIDVLRRVVTSLVAND